MAGRIDLRVVDVAVALGLSAAAVVAAPGGLGMGLVKLAACVAAPASVAFRRRSPLLAVLAAVTALLVVQAVGGQSLMTVQPLAVQLDFYFLARNLRREQETGRDMAALGYALGAVGAIAVDAGHPTLAGITVTWAFFAGLPFTLGRRLARRASLRGQLREMTDELEREQELSVHRAADEERNRMARDLHDVIAHNLSVMVIQTAAAREVAHRDLTAAREALSMVESSGREALAELRRIVGPIRKVDDDLGGHVPGLASLGPLVARTQAAGLPVEVRIEGPASALPAGVDVVAYRLVQEALTNALKYAGPARVSVRVRVALDAVDLEVSDTGRGPPSQPGRQGDGSGLGLVGMRERVGLYGGDVSAGRGPEGGFVVHARIPLPSPRS